MVWRYGGQLISTKFGVESDSIGFRENEFYGRTERRRTLTVKQSKAELTIREIFVGASLAFLNVGLKIATVVMRLIVTIQNLELMRLSVSETFAHPSKFC